MGDGGSDTHHTPTLCLVFLSVNMLRVASVSGAILWRWEQSFGDYQVK